MKLNAIISVDLSMADTHLEEGWKAYENGSYDMAEARLQSATSCIQHAEQAFKALQSSSQATEAESEPEPEHESDDAELGHGSFDMATASITAMFADEEPLARIIEKGLDKQDAGAYNVQHDEGTDTASTEKEKKGLTS